MTSFLTTELPAGQTLEMPCNNVPNQAFQTAATPSSLTSIPVTNVRFVDSSAPLTGQAGTLDHPFRTIQQAVDSLVSNVTTSGIVRIAPGGYAENISVPDSDMTTIVFEGWGKENPYSSANLPTITGDVTIAQKTVGSWVVCLAGLTLVGNITTANTGTDDAIVKLSNVAYGPGTIEANDLTVHLVHTEFFSGTFIRGNASMDLTTDGYSWGQLVRAATTLAPIDYTREFNDSGCDWAQSNLNVTGLAVGSSTTYDLTHSTARQGEFGAITKVGAAPAADFMLTFSHTGTGTFTVVLTNFSRLSGTFTDPVQTLVWHQSLPQIPEPP